MTYWIVGITVLCALGLLAPLLARRFMRRVAENTLNQRTEGRCGAADISTHLGWRRRDDRCSRTPSNPALDERRAPGHGPGDRRTVLPADAGAGQLLSAHRDGVARVLATWTNARLLRTRSIAEFLGAAGPQPRKAIGPSPQHRLDYGSRAGAYVRARQAGGRAIDQHILKKESAAPQTASGSNG